MIVSLPAIDLLQRSEVARPFRRGVSHVHPHGGEEQEAQAKQAGVNELTPREFLFHPSRLSTKGPPPRRRRARLGAGEAWPRLRQHRFLRQSPAATMSRRTFIGPWLLTPPVRPAAAPDDMPPAPDALRGPPI